MKELLLTRGYVALVDDDDFERLNQYRWSAAFRGKLVYGKRKLPQIKKWRYLHRDVLGVIDSSVKIDHQNRNGLDCQKANLRVATKSQNSGNAERRANNTSGFKGVSWAKTKNKFRACIGMNGKSIYLGYFHNAEDAARAYDTAALEYFGEFAHVNAEG